MNCRCGKVALSRVGKVGYCRAHHPAAVLKRQEEQQAFDERRGNVELTMPLPSVTRAGRRRRP